MSYWKYNHALIFPYNSYVEEEGLIYCDSYSNKSQYAEMFPFYEA